MSDAATQRWGGHILEAALQVIAEEGFAAVSMRGVAAAAGVSLAQVQYYFRSKDELLAAAFEHVSHEVVAQASTIDTSGPPQEVLRALLHLWLPMDEPRVRTARVWLAFTAAAVTSPDLGARNAAVDQDLRAHFAALLTEARTRGELRTDLDIDGEATLLLAVVDGLVVQALTRPPAERADLLVAGLDTHLNRLFATHP
ncbi:TetR family transcriptional regulator [Saccharopolyspora sp. HNM0986]|uniref:TetR/AcrR family transcriptional regulator n=1 Tax=Saccharopolyspora galaxeae TaxID=2781241 RepID=UPI001909D9C5|nr:TetR/AcrR family transcriptional regulator [Saccharopolyspora sp. HNM0986]MBK0869755.1 TetR family transcriptional regulator [Saccharopolyspora sp. HNM0986]